VRVWGCAYSILSLPASLASTRSRRMNSTSTSRAMSTPLMADDNILPFSHWHSPEEHEAALIKNNRSRANCEDS
jgi:hypothetical protein